MRCVTPSAKPGLGGGSLAPMDEHLRLQIVSEKPAGGRIRLCDCSHLFPGDLHIINVVGLGLVFFLKKLANAFKIHAEIYFSLAIASLSHGGEFLWAAEQVGAVFKNLCLFFIV